MKKKDVPKYEDFYNQFITLNKTNKQLCEYYKVSDFVIHKWKRLYGLKKDMDLVLKSFVHKGWEKGHKTWNKGIHKPTSDKCKATYFTKEDIFNKAKKSFGVPKIECNRTGKRLICLSEETRYVKNNKNGKIYEHHKRIGYAQWILKQNGIEIPKGYVVYHRDGNYMNNDIGNLEIISRAELCKRNCPK